MAKEVNYWEAQDGSLHKKEIDAVEADIVLLGGDDAYFEMLVEQLEQCKEKLTFNLIGFPDRIAYRLMYSGYIGQLYTSFSNADLAEQYSIFIYKKGVKPTMQLKMVIQHEKNEKYKHFKELYGKNYVEPKVITMKLETLSLVDTYQLCLWAEEKYGMSNNEWHKKIWRGKDGLCECFENTTYVTFEKTTEPETLLEEHINEFLEDFPELNGKVSFIFTS